MIKLNRSSLLIATVAIVTSSASSAAAESIYVKVKSTKLRSQPSFISSTSGSLSYGDQVDKVESEGSWIKVRTRAKAVGYLHESSVSESRIVLSSGSAHGSKPDSADVVLAGKGFSAEVEKSYASSHRELNFSAVNAMERIVISDKELSDFSKDGGIGKES